MKIETTTVTQTANETLGTKEKTLYYLIVKGASGGKLVINVGEKTHKEVKKLIEAEPIEQKELSLAAKLTQAENKKQKERL